MKKYTLNFQNIKKSIQYLADRRGIIFNTDEEIVSELENRFEEIISHNTAQREKYEQEEKKTWDIE